MTDDQPTQPLTDADERVLNRDLLWAPGTDTITESQMNAIRTRHGSAAQPIPSKTALGYDHLMAHADRAALLAEVDRLRSENHTVTEENSALLRKLEEQYRLRAENARLRAENATMGRYMHELDRENERLRLETAQMESGAQIAMNAGVTALQEVKRLEAMIAAVVAIHKPTGINSWGHRTCNECDTPGYYQEWPCPTLVALGFEER